MGTSLYGTKYDKSGNFGLVIQGFGVEYCLINRTFKEAIEKASDLANEGNRVEIWTVAAENQSPVIVDIYTKQY